jgi:hypothetical protein
VLIEAYLCNSNNKITLIQLVFHQVDRLNKEDLARRHKMNLVISKVRYKLEKFQLKEIQVKFKCLSNQ